MLFCVVSSLRATDSVGHPRLYSVPWTGQTGLLNRRGTNDRRCLMRGSSIAVCAAVTLVNSGSREHSPWSRLNFQKSGSSSNAERSRQPTPTRRRSLADFRTYEAPAGQAGRASILQLPAIAALRPKHRRVSPSFGRIVGARADLAPIDRKHGPGMLPSVRASHYLPGNKWSACIPR